MPNILDQQKIEILSKTSDEDLARIAADGIRAFVKQNGARIRAAAIENEFFCSTLFTEMVFQFINKGDQVELKVSGRMEPIECVTVKTTRKSKTIKAKG